MTKNGFHGQLVESIFCLSRLMKDKMSYSSELTKLSLLQLQALIFLNKQSKAQMRQIADQFNVEMPTATSLINKLCKENLVKRDSDIKDRRIVRIKLTAKGTKLLELATKKRNEKIEKILSYLSESDKKELLRIVKIIIEKMEIKNEK